jgi:hypothetical protein
MSQLLEGDMKFQATKYKLKSSVFIRIAAQQKYRFEKEWNLK